MGEHKIPRGDQHLPPKAAPTQEERRSITFLVCAGCYDKRKPLKPQIRLSLQKYGKHADGTDRFFCPSCLRSRRNIESADPR